MPKETIYDGMIQWGNTVVFDTDAQECYEEFSQKLTPYDFERLDDIYNAEIEALLLKCFKEISGTTVALSQASPLLKALVFRRIKLILDYYGDKQFRVVSQTRAILMHSLFVEWHFVKRTNPSAP